MTINELREKRNQAWNAAKAFVETKRDKDGLLSEEDAKTYPKLCPFREIPSRPSAAETTSRSTAPKNRKRQRESARNAESR